MFNCHPCQAASCAVHGGWPDKVSATHIKDIMLQATEHGVLCALPVCRHALVLGVNLLGHHPVGQGLLALNLLLTTQRGQHVGHHLAVTLVVSTAQQAASDESPVRTQGAVMHKHSSLPQSAPPNTSVWPILRHSTLSPVIGLQAQPKLSKD